MAASVAASGQWRDEDGVRQPGGEAHAWEPGTNQTLCGLALSRSQLVRFPHVPFSAVASGDGGGGGDGRQVQRVCPRCSAATGRRRAGQRSWTRVDPRP
ncbi:hypothetical protein SAMN05428996_0033 [Quadrisphaera sp. DSM 44207]|nr:hypothetical protein SAMN05428996_0033 [Quadrisphaera sp. DSM 44207]